MTTTTATNVYPKIDTRYRLAHAGDKPFMLYPDEKSIDVGEYIITSYNRIWHKKREDFVKTVKGIYVPTFIKTHWPDDYETNPYVKANFKNTPNREWYNRNKDELQAKRSAKRKAVSNNSK